VIAPAESPVAHAPGSCVACRGATQFVESIERSALVDAWRREDASVGATSAIESRSRDLANALPRAVEFHRCVRCGLEMARPACVWSASSYPRDQSYPIRWEFTRALDDIGHAPSDVLEIGCGAGWFLEQSLARGHRAVGMDFSEAAVRQAASRGVRAIHGGFDELTRQLGAQGRFDAVAMFHVIEHLEDPDTLLATIRRWTRPGAHLVISCPGPRRFTRLIHEQRAGRSDFWDYPPQHVLRWTLPALRALCARHGWRVVVAMEEPFSWTAAGSHIGMARAQYRAAIDHPLRRRFSIAVGWWRLLRAPALRHGVSVYIHAVRDDGRAA